MKLFHNWVIEIRCFQWIVFATQTCRADGQIVSFWWNRNCVVHDLLLLEQMFSAFIHLMEGALSYQFLHCIWTIVGGIKLKHWCRNASFSFWNWSWTSNNIDFGNFARILDHKWFGSFDSCLILYRQHDDAESWTTPNTEYAVTK